MNEQDKKALSNYMVNAFTDAMDNFDPADELLSYGRKAMNLDTGSMLDALWTGFVMGASAGMELANTIEEMEGEQCR